MIASDTKVEGRFFRGTQASLVTNLKITFALEKVLITSKCLLKQ